MSMRQNVLTAIGFLAMAGTAAGKDLGAIQGAVSASEKVASESERAKIFQSVISEKVKEPREVEALDAALKSLEKRYKSGPNEEALKMELHVLQKLLASSTDPGLHPGIARLLEREEPLVPSKYLGPAKGLSVEDRNKEGIRMARLFALIEAAGSGGNQQALSGLRRIAKKGGLVGEVADKAIARIGSPEDLDRMIGQIKNDPKSRVDLTPFGGQIVGRLVKEIEDSSTTDGQRQRLIAHLGQGKGPGSVPRYAALLDHRDPRVVEASANALADSIRPGDDALALRMIPHKNRNVRFAGILSLKNVEWKAEFRPVIEDLLANDPDEGVRALAADLLGAKRVTDAQDALRGALQDRSSRVRGAAQAAIDRVSGKEDQEIDRAVNEILRRRGKR